MFRMAVKHHLKGSVRLPDVVTFNLLKTSSTILNCRLILAGERSDIC